MSGLKVGDPITSVRRNGLARATVTRAGRGLLFEWAQADSIVSFDYIDTEGYEWIRGHHDETTTAGRALLAANMLAASAGLTAR